MEEWITVEEMWDVASVMAWLEPLILQRARDFGVTPAIWVAGALLTFTAVSHAEASEVIREILAWVKTNVIFQKSEGEEEVYDG